MVSVTLTGAKECRKVRIDPSIRLTRISDPKALDAAEREAAFDPAGEPFHEIWIHA